MFYFKSCFSTELRIDFNLQIQLYLKVDMLSVCFGPYKNFISPILLFSLDLFVLNWGPQKYWLCKKATFIVLLDFVMTWFKIFTRNQFTKLSESLSLSYAGLKKNCKSTF